MTIESDEKLAIEYLGSKRSVSDGAVKFTYVEPGGDRETECINALCRLLRSREPLSIGLRSRLATLFDPAAETIEARQLVFRRRRGGPNEPSDARSLEIASAIAAELKAGHKLESVIADAVQVFGVSRSTVQLAWRKHKGGRPMMPRSWAGWRWDLEAPAACKNTVWRMLVATNKRRPLTRDEIRLRCASQPRPWRDLGISPSTWYRRRKRAAGKS